MAKLYYLLIALFCALSANVSAQTDEKNFKKYWKFRNNFRRDFIKIGAERGEGIPVASRLPIGCKNNLEDKETLCWGDRVIFCEIELDFQP